MYVRVKIMSITETKLEELVRGETDESELDDEDVASAVEGHRALQQRLQTAFNSVRPGIHTFVRIQSAVSSAGIQPPSDVRHTRPFPRWHVAVSAAAMVLVVLGAAMLLGPGANPPTEPGSAPGKIAQAVLAHIHSETASHPAHPSEDWTELRGYLAETTGIAPRRVSGSRLRLVGGSRTELFGESAASYVMQTPQGPVTVVVMRMHPDRLNFDHCREVDARRLWACGFREYRMVAVRVGKLTYCCIGKLDHDKLSQILLPLLNTTTSTATR
jgi:hypothetical protein